MHSVKIAIADDQNLFREGMVSLLKSFNLNVIIEAKNGKDLIEQLRLKRPQVIFLDLKMPEMNGLETLQYLKEHYPQIKVLILTMHDHEKFILHSLEQGANGFLLKDAESKEVLSAIQQVMTEGDYYNAQTLQVMRTGLRQIKKRGIPTFTPNEELSTRELEVVDLSCQGLTASEIGEKLFIAKKTVEGHRKNILAKTGCKNIVEMVVYAIRNNLVSLE